MKITLALRRSFVAPPTARHNADVRRQIVQGADQRSRDDVVRVANEQRRLLWCFLGSLFFIPIIAIPGIGLVIGALVSVAQGYFVYRAARAVYSPLAWLYGLFMLVPGVALVTLFAVNRECTLVLKSAGIKVGVMGARKKDIAAYAAS
jgi:hypothetical protein